MAPASGTCDSSVTYRAPSPRLLSSTEPLTRQRRGWSLATAYALLAWYVFAPQCLSTLVVVRRETNSWRYPLIMAGYLFALAYVAAFITYRVALALGGGG